MYLTIAIAWGEIKGEKRQEKKTEKYDKKQRKKTKKELKKEKEKRVPFKVFQWKHFHFIIHTHVMGGLNVF